jgi:hypothetical protein
MTPTVDNRAELRIYLDDQATPTMFTDAELDLYIGRADSIYAAAARLWLLKAARYQRQMGLYGRVQNGQETYETHDLAKLLAFCKTQSQFYADLATEEAGTGTSLIISFEAPEVL